MKEADLGAAGADPISDDEPVFGDRHGLSFVEKDFRCGLLVVAVEASWTLSADPELVLERLEEELGSPVKAFVELDLPRCVRSFSVEIRTFGLGTVLMCTSAVGLFVGIAEASEGREFLNGCWLSSVLIIST